jgi:hypothetical protein
MAPPLQHRQAPKRLGIPSPSAGNNRANGPEVHYALAFNLDHSMGAVHGKANVALYGALASILDFAMGARHAKATADGGLCRVLMVAGAHNRRSLPISHCFV